MPTLLSNAMSIQTLLKCKGYDASFILPNTPVDIRKVLPAKYMKLLPQVKGNPEGILNYTNLSVLYNKERKLPFVSAYNIDGSSKSTTVKRTSFRKDERLDDDLQLDNHFYDLKKDITEFEIGHMSANNEMAWGKQAQVQSYQTFHFPNSVPQAERLNTGIWKGLESYIIKESAGQTNNNRICVFTGPILKKNDPPYVLSPDFRIPLLFFKVIVFEYKNKLYSTAFIMSHEQKLIEDKLIVPKMKPLSRGAVSPEAVLAFNDYPYKKVFQVNIPTLETLSGLHFTWKGVNQISFPQEKNQIEKIKSIGSSDDLRGRGMADAASRTLTPRKSIPATTLIMPG
ncbi:MAG: DNA/RNA non-specific endonuclease [Chitinophagaceae bacterium]|nr:DNA/RNA non-specific endonuclease [Chitinophagaceae bacterium]